MSEINTFFERHVDTENDNEYEPVISDGLKGSIQTEVWAIIDVFHDGNKAEEQEKRDDITERIYATISNSWVVKESISGIKGNGQYLTLKYTSESWEKTLVFNVLAQDDENIYAGNQEQVEDREAEKQAGLRADLSEFENLVDAMDYIFDKNKDEFWGYLNDKDIMDTNSFGPELKWKTIKEIQWLARISLWNLNTGREAVKKVEIPLDINIDKEKKRYLHFIMGIGWDYEWGAKLFEKDEWELDDLVASLVSSYSDDEELLTYLENTHRKIDRNNYQSTSVERSYKLFADKLHRSIFDKFKDKKSEDKDFLRFAKIITWRGIHGRAWIDNRLKDPHMSNEIIIHIMWKEWGVMDRINESWKIIIEDKEVGKKSPIKIVSDTISKLQVRHPDSGEIIPWNGLLEKLWFSDVIWLQEDNYQNLRLEQKVKISILVRLLKKIESGEPISLEKLEVLFRKVAEDWNKAIENWLSDNFNASLFDWNGKDSKDFWLTGIEAEIFDLYNDINGNGLFDLADRTKWGLFIAGKIWVAIVAGIAIWIAITAAAPFIAWAAVIAGSAVLTWAVIWVGATAVAMLMFPKGYDSWWEAATDISSEIVFWAATGAFWGHLVNKYWFHGAKWLSPEWKRNIWIFAWDLAILGLWVEAARMMGVDYIFHKDPILQEK